MSVKAILTEQARGGGSGSIALQYIEVTTPPTKTSYLSGETFNSSGMVVTGYYGISESVIVTSAALTGYSVEPTAMTDGVTSVTITYTEGGRSRSCTQAVTVTAIPTGMTITTAPTATQTYLGTVSNTGTVARVTYSNGSTQNKQASSLTRTVPSGSTWNAVGNQTMTFSYTENGKTVTASTTVTVQKASQSITFKPTTITINASNYQNGSATTMTYRGNGTVSVYSGTTTGLTATIGTPSASATNTSSTVAITVKGNGSTAVAARSITIQVAESTYFKSGTASFTASAEYWSWGTESEIGDASWWAGLKSWAAGASATERANCVGKKKKVSLSTAVLGANAINMICIGADYDGTGTLTFQSESTLPTSFAYSTNRGSNDASTQWEGSTAQTHCNSIASYCSAANSIKQITVQWSSVCNGSKTNTPDKTATAKVWLPAECQMGIAGTCSSSSTEWNLNMTNQAAYPYYTDATSRKKFAGDANGNATTTTSWYWERSRYYSTSSSNSVCFVVDTGNANYYTYNYTGGRLAPAFVIG